MTEHFRDTILYRELIRALALKELKIRRKRVFRRPHHEFVFYV
jgi:hypothetical protein